MDLSSPSQPAVAPAPSEAAERDADIVALLATGQRVAAFAQVMARYEGKVYRLCLAMLREPALAQEAAQDALLRIWRALDAHDPARAALSTWIYAVTRNRCLTLLAQSPPPASSLEEPATAAEVDHLLQASGEEGEVASRALLRRLVEALPAAWRLSLVLYYFEERSVAEVAAQCGLPEGTVKTHLHRARSALRDQLQARGLADPALWLA